MQGPQIGVPKICREPATSHRLQSLRLTHPLIATLDSGTRSCTLGNTPQGLEQGCSFHVVAVSINASTDFRYYYREFNWRVQAAWGGGASPDWGSVRQEGQDCILRRVVDPPAEGRMQASTGGLPIRRRITTCPAMHSPKTVMHLHPSIPDLPTDADSPVYNDFQVQIS